MSAVAELSVTIIKAGGSKNPEITSEGSMKFGSLRILLLICTRVAVLSQQPSSFLLEGFRGQVERNLISFQCTNAETGQPAPDAIFMLDGTELGEKAGRTLSRGSNPNTILFQITREFEGNYSCGFRVDDNNIIVSNPVPFVALPERSLNPAEQTFFAKLGSTAVLHCSITPGRLIQQYFVTWTNGSSGEVYRDRHRRPINSPTSDPRYTIDPSTLSLRISNVQLIDSDPYYRCTLGVTDPANDNDLIYTQTATTNIRLIVYKAPRIIVPPTDQTVSLKSARQTSFNCTAVGDPAPKITWRVNATSPQTYVPSQSDPVPDPQGRGYMIHGTIRIFSLSARSTGSVECVASVLSSAENTGGQVVPSDTRKARLSVLGRFKNKDIIVTQDGDVIYKLRLRSTINIPVHLLLMYTDAATGMPYNRTTTISFNNTNNIIHIEFRSRIPFPRFRVSVGIIDSISLTAGPLDSMPLVYDTSRPTVISTDITMFRIIVAAATPVIFFFLLFVFIIIMTLICRIHNKKPHVATKNCNTVLKKASKDLPTEDMTDCPNPPPRLLNRQLSRQQSKVVSRMKEMVDTLMEVPQLKQHWKDKYYATTGLNSSNPSSESGSHVYQPLLSAPAPSSAAPPEEVIIEEQKETQLQ